MKQNINRLIKALWIRACRFDCIDHKAKFVIFSDENPYIRRYNKMVCLRGAGDRIMSDDGFHRSLA